MVITVKTCVVDGWYPQHRQQSGEVAAVPNTYAWYPTHRYHPQGCELGRRTVSDLEQGSEPAWQPGDGAVTRRWAGRTGEEVPVGMLPARKTQTLSL